MYGAFILLIRHGSVYMLNALDAQIKLGVTFKEGLLWKKCSRPFL